MPQWQQPKINTDVTDAIIYSSADDTSTSGQFNSCSFLEWQSDARLRLSGKISANKDDSRTDDVPKPLDELYSLLRYGS